MTSTREMAQTLTPETAQEILLARGSSYHVGVAAGMKGRLLCAGGRLVGELVHVTNDDGEPCAACVAKLKTLLFSVSQMIFAARTPAHEEALALPWKEKAVERETDRELHRAEKLAGSVRDVAENIERTVGYAIEHLNKARELGIDVERDFLAKLAAQISHEVLWMVPNLNLDLLARYGAEADLKRVDLVASRARALASGVEVVEWEAGACD